MKGLILKDLYSLRKYYLLWGTIMLCFACMMIIFLHDEEVTIINRLIICMYATLITSIIPVGLYNTDENEKWLCYSATMPISRKTYISSKYILITCLNLVISFIAFTLQIIVTSEININILMLYMAGIFGTGFIVPTVILPISVKFGSKKSIIFSVIIGTICGIIGGILSDEEVFNSFTFGNIEWYISFLVLAGVILLYMLSWLLSIYLYKKKEL